MTEFISQKRSEILESQLETLFHVGKVLSFSLDLSETLQGVLEKLHQYAGLRYGMVTLRSEREELAINAVYTGGQDIPKARYRTGEGIIGATLKAGQILVINRLEDDTRFLDKLGLYDLTLPFIAAPVQVEKQTVGVLAAQPKSSSFLKEHTRFMEMVSQLIAQTVRLSKQIEKEQQSLKEERDQLKRTVKNSYGFDNVIGRAQKMQKVFEIVRQVAKWNTTVLIRGESGTGKELIANAIHYNSPRNNSAFVKINCAALPENLLESELFGHEKGAFSGAVNQHKGRFERADKGTIFLDEIGEISASFQAKLLRILQEGELERVGGNRVIKVDVRVITATNVNLEQAVEQGKFREDLYYRLNVMPIYLPPLRERIEDIPELAIFLVNKIAKNQQRKLKLSDNAIRVLIQYNWPGNVRELENCLERAAIMSENGIIEGNTIQLMNENMVTNHVNPIVTNTPAPIPIAEENKPDLTDDKLDERERVIAALEQAGWVQAKAARLLGMTPRQIAYRIQTLGIKVKNF